MLWVPLVIRESLFQDYARPLRQELQQNCSNQLTIYFLLDDIILILFNFVLALPTSDYCSHCRLRLRLRLFVTLVQLQPSDTL